MIYIVVNERHWKLELRYRGSGGVYCGCMKSKGLVVAVWWVGDELNMYEGLGINFRALYYDLQGINCRCVMSRGWTVDVLGVED